MRLASPLLAVVLIPVLAACGSSKDDKESEDQRSEDATGSVVSQAQPEPGPQGAPGVAGPQGPQGPQGPAGADGAKGQDGKDGDHFGIGLFDKNGRFIGWHLDEGSAARVFLDDGTQALIDRATGALRAPTPAQAFCLYEAAACAGPCLVDQSTLNLIVVGSGGTMHAAALGSADLGAKTIQSYVHDDGTCQAASFGTTESFAAASYDPGSRSFPLPAPLHWKLVKSSP